MFSSYVNQVIQYEVKALTDRELKVLELIVTHDSLSIYQIWKLVNQTTKISYKNMFGRIKKLENDDFITRQTGTSKKAIYYKISTKGIMYLLSIGRYIHKILIYYDEDPVVNSLVYDFFDEKTVLDYSTSFLYKQLSGYLQKCMFLSIRKVQIIKNLKIKIQHYDNNQKNDQEITLYLKAIDRYIDNLKEELELEIERENRNLFFNIALEVKEDTTPLSYNLPAYFEVVRDQIPIQPPQTSADSILMSEIERVSYTISKINEYKISNQKKIKFSSLKQGNTIDLQICYNDGGIENLHGSIKDVSKSRQGKSKIFGLSIDFDNYRKGVFEIIKQVDIVKIRQTLANDPSLPRLRNDKKAFNRIIQLREELDTALNKMNLGK